MIVISDTSPISNLLLIQRLDILQSVFTEVIVPTAVDREIQALKKFGKDIGRYQTAKWITVSEPSDLEKLKTLRTILDEGEAQAIALAIELKCELLLMDERLGTTVARDEGLQTVGLAGY